ncbi:MAG TPA: hypothetical protein DCK83_00405 [Gallionellaceae bacterium]|nr:hypothetical protein [Gallionellaceae bacterium]
MLHLATITAIESADGCVMQGKVVRQLSIVINEPGDGCEMRGEVDIYAAAKAEDEFWLMVA